MSLLDSGAMRVTVHHAAKSQCRHAQRAWNGTGLHQMAVAQVDCWTGFASHDLFR